MKIPFENFDGEEFVENKDQKISFMERALMVSFTGLIKIVLWKVGRVRTYGDLYSIAKFISIKIQGFEDKTEEMDDDLDPQKIVNEMVKELDEAGEELKGHMGS